MPNPIIRCLEYGARLSDVDREALAHLTRNTRIVSARRTLVDEGDPVTHGLVVLDGWACRCKILDSGHRQITELMLPGDACHVHAHLRVCADHSIATLSTCMIADVDPTEMEALLRQPGPRRALCWSSLQTDSIMREALVNNGQRHAAQRIAHLICEVRERLRAVEMVEHDTFAWPITQEELGEITSMTSVHINRTLRFLRNSGLIALNNRELRVVDFEKLATFSDFRNSYLHLKSQRT
ncbi:Crp/Fnr family transcriptional regulator [Methylobacterium brachiatum]|jgi:CRP-like cAMP-binding protein|uniref:Crp/Fnr family transcriptional regulator n=1 Tax=Methylobacterium brachiatum TaxID=269660 RepID=UPI00244B54DD|nr:Crp/Fnr family transcriptional regulator [Methylobacterium brachiatum]MDH2313269.1 Crp/Fnr family transcriptional regulator [Methylobacterium brachiatum]